MRVVSALDEVGEGHARLGLVPEAFALAELALVQPVGIAMALAGQSVLDILGRGASTLRQDLMAGITPTVRSLRTLLFSAILPKDNFSRLELCALLAVVRLTGSECYGVAIHDDVQQRMGRGVSVAAIYSALSRLESQGLVRSEMSEPTGEPGGRSRRLFLISPEGTRALADERAIRDRLWEGVDGALDGVT